MKISIILITCLAALGCSTNLNNGFWIMEDPACPTDTHVNLCHRIDDKVICSCVWQDKVA